MPTLLSVRRCLERKNMEGSFFFPRRRKSNEKVTQIFRLKKYIFARSNVSLNGRKDRESIGRGWDREVGRE